MLPRTEAAIRELRVERERAGCAIECRLDGATFAHCGAVVSCQGARGRKAPVRSAGRRRDRAAGGAWTVDTVAPAVSITDGPNDPTRETAATFALLVQRDD